MAEPSTDTFSSDSGPVPFVDDMPREGSSMPYFPTKDTQKNPANIASLIGDGDAARRNIIAGETKLIEKQIGFEGAQQRQQDMRDNRYRERMERMVSAEGTTADDLKPWNAEQELAEHKTDLWSQFGSPGFIISMLASAFTAQPMNTALTAGAAAMNAINQGDMNAYNKAFDVWKENTNLTLKRLGLEHERFADIDKLRTTDMAAWRTKVELLMRQFGDERKLMLLQNGMDPELDQAFEGQWKAEEGLASAKEALEKNHLRTLITNADPRFKSGDPAQMAAAIQDAEDTVTGATEKMTPVQLYMHKFMQENPRATSAQILEAGQKAYQVAAKTFMQDEKNHTNPKWLASPQGQEWIGTQPPDQQAQYHAFVSQFAGGTDPAAVQETAREIGQYRLPPLSGFVLKSDFGAKVLKELGEQYPNYSAARYWGGISAQRAAGTRGGQIVTSAVEADRTFKLALTANAAFTRGQYVPINRLRQMGAQAASNPKFRQFMAANEAAVTAYGATMSRSGVNTVAAQSRAHSVLDTADSPQAYAAGVQQLQLEVNAVRSAPQEASEELLRGLFGSGYDPNNAPPPQGTDAAPISGTTSHGVPWSVQP